MASLYSNKILYKNEINFTVDRDWLNFTANSEIKTKKIGARKQNDRKVVGVFFCYSEKTDDTL